MWAGLNLKHKKHGFKNCADASHAVSVLSLYVSHLHTAEKFVNTLTTKCSCHSVHILNAQPVRHSSVYDDAATVDRTLNAELNEFCFQTQIINECHCIWL